MMPIKKLLDADGEEVRVEVKYPGRSIFARCWVVQIGRTSFTCSTPTFRKMNLTIAGSAPDSMEVTAVPASNRKCW